MFFRKVVMVGLEVSLQHDAYLPLSNEERYDQDEDQSRQEVNVRGIHGKSMCIEICDTDRIY